MCVCVCVRVHAQMYSDSVSSIYISYLCMLWGTADTAETHINRLSFK